MFITKRKSTSMTKYSFIICICSLGSSLQGFAQSDSSRLDDFDFRVKKIEEFRAIDDKKFENKAKELDLKVEEYRQQKSVLDWIAISLGPITLLSLWGFWQKAKSMADKKIEERLDKVLEEKRQLFINVIDSHDRENQIKREKTILIVSDKTANTKFLMGFFKKLGFEKTELLKVDTYLELDEQRKYDVLFLFREQDNHPLEEDVAKLYIKHSRPDSIVFTFGKHLNDLPNEKYRLSSATFWTQLYGNLVSALKYQELID